MSPRALSLPHLLLTLLTSFCLMSCDDASSTAALAAEQGMLIIGNNAEPQSLDPHKATAVSDGRIISALLEGLVRPSPQDASEMLPGVAERWEHNEDASIWTFYLRPSAQWSDGHPLQAQDFDYAYRRLLHPQYGGKYAEMLYPLRGAEAYNKGESPWENVGVKIINDHCLQLHLEGPTPKLLQHMLHYTWYPIPAHAVEAHGGMLDRRSLWTQVEHWVGNGAYVLHKHQFNDFLELRASPSYWRKDEVQNKGIRFMPIVNGFTETRMFMDGKLHISNNVPPEMIAYAKQEAGSQYKQSPYYACIFYRLNTQRPPLDDVRVRHALSLAIDREALVSKVVRGAGKATTSFTPPSTGFAVEAPQQPSTQEAREELARQLLAQAGYPKGAGFPTIELMTTSREVQRIMAECIQAFWFDVLGIRVQIRVNEWTAYKAAQQQGHYDISSSSWSGDFLDPSNFVELWRSGAGNNNTFWSNSHYDALLDQARRCIDIQQGLQMLAQAEALMLEEQPIIPLYWSERCYLQSPEVEGFYPCLLETQPLDAVRLNPSPLRKNQHD